MSRILVIGGYGGFGARLCRRLAAAGHHILVGGRHESRAAAFAATLPHAGALAVDREGDLESVLARHRPDLVIDAAGPFQGSEYRVPEACIVAGISYLDLADAPGFVAGIGKLDHAARSRGVAIVSGASTSPALTTAVARRLAEGVDRIEAVDIALSAANRAAGGESVIAAVLSTAGNPIRLWRGGRWTDRTGWQELRREDFAISGVPPLRGRLVALADLPDCALLPELLPGRPAVSFRAGTELGFQMRLLRLASGLVRRRLLPPLAGAQRLLVALYRLTSRIGGLRSATSVTLAGRAGGRMVERRWTIIAERGEGLEIPTLAAALLAGDAAAGRLRAGAYCAAGLLTLDRYAQALAALPVRWEVSERDLPAPLYAHLLGRAWADLPDAVRTMHDFCRDAGAAGEGVVARGTGPVARLIGRLMRFPPAGAWPLHVAFSAEEGIETWARDFGGHGFSSTLSRSNGLLVERFGPLRFGFALRAGPDGLDMHLRRWSVFGLSLPLALAPRIAAREWEEQGRFRFEIGVAMPLVGEVIAYRGWLERAGAQSSRRAPEAAAA